MSNAYKILPQVYDRWQNMYGKDYTSLIFPKLLSTLRNYRVPVSTMIDIACGTGTLAFMMAKRGWQVWGIDASAGMIEEAAKKRARKNQPVFVQQAMEECCLDAKVSLATSFFDSLNHLSSKKDLLRTFLRVQAHLLPGGFFVFDVNNEHCYKTLWCQTEAVHHRDFTLILENAYDAIRRVARSDVTLFIRQRDSYVRQVETVHERFFPNKEIEQLLKTAGFAVMEGTDFNFTGNPDLGDIKTWWVARKA